MAIGSGFTSARGKCPRFRYAMHYRLSCMRSRWRCVGGDEGLWVAWVAVTVAMFGLQVVLTGPQNESSFFNEVVKEGKFLAYT